MLDIVKRFFSSEPSGPGEDASAARGHDINVAVCALFLEMARIDDSFSQSELETILSILEKSYGLAGEHADALMTVADAELKESVDLWQFARLINENYTPEEKVRVIETLWRIVFVDGQLDQHEDYLMHRLAKLLRLTHKQLIDAKLKARYPK